MVCGLLGDGFCAPMRFTIMFYFLVLHVKERMEPTSEKITYFNELLQNPHATDREKQRKAAVYYKLKVTEFYSDDVDMNKFHHVEELDTTGRTAYENDVYVTSFHEDHGPRSYRNEVYLLPNDKAFVVAIETPDARDYDLCALICQCDYHTMSVMNPLGYILSPTMYNCLQTTTRHTCDQSVLDKTRAYIAQIDRN